MNAEGITCGRISAEDIIKDICVRNLNPQVVKNPGGAIGGSPRLRNVKKFAIKITNHK
jgi:hypothetical protein